MKEECKLCSVNAWSGTGHTTTDFSISSLMRPTVHHAGADPRQDAVLLSAYLFKLGDYPLYSLHDYYAPGKPTTGCLLCDVACVDPYGYYQPAGPLIKESNAEADRALARYHPQAHYHTPHPPMLQQYGPPYYPDLCYGRYYRPPGPYHITPPQPDAPIVGVASDPYPPSQYYGTPPCYQHSPQRIPYVEYRCPCPLNACPKNVLIGPATGKAPTGSGPADLTSALAPPGGAFRPKVRACAPESAGNTHGSGKDPPLETGPPAAADAPQSGPLPAIGGASPKRELFDVRENIRVVRPPETLGPPSPARGSVGICALQPPPIAPRRARLGKAMARRSLAGDDTGIFISVPQPPPAHSDADDDVLAISPPVCGPIDLSSSDERSTPLVDVKKENDGPIYALARKPEAQALREHNNCTIVSDSIMGNEGIKAVKRRYSRPKLDIDMKDTQLEDSCKTNGIGEHVKLQKRRKVSGDHTDFTRIETITKEPKKKLVLPKKVPKTQSTEKKNTKRKRDNSSSSELRDKIMLTEIEGKEKNSTIPAAADDSLIPKPKTKSAQLLDNLIRKNSIDRSDAKKYTSDTEIDPAELFLPPNENITQIKKDNENKKTNINNNVLETTINAVRPNTIAAVTQLIEEKQASKNSCNPEKVDCKITSSKSVLQKPDIHSIKKMYILEENRTNDSLEKDIVKPAEAADKPETVRNPTPEAMNLCITNSIEKITNDGISLKPKPTNQLQLESTKKELTIEESQQTKTSFVGPEDMEVAAVMGQERPGLKRCKLSKGKFKGRKPSRLLVSKKVHVKTDDVTMMMRDLCDSPDPSLWLRGRMRKKGRGRRARSPVEMDLVPKYPPRWSNGWKWDGDNKISLVYINNDQYQVRKARTWGRMTHASGDTVARGDSVLLRPSEPKAQPFVAKVANLWENPIDGEMMLSLIWYYRPEHTERGRQPEDAPDEVFVSKHRDTNSVACIEDKCYVLSFNEYCRYRKRLKAAEEGITIQPTIVPDPSPSDRESLFATMDSRLPDPVSPELVMFTRYLYDMRTRKVNIRSRV